MELFELSALLSLDDKQFNKGIRNAESLGQKAAGKIGAATVAMGNLITDAVRKGISGISSIVHGAVDGYADYQQLIGGVETLFKTSAGKVASYAKQSYKTTGLSANAYMETVTSFSASLLQGLKGDTEAAADVADTAMTDMADNANKLGTDMASIQAAYMGFAKQNYTMLDNLRLGYGGTKEEMVRLVNESGILEEEIEDLDGITFDQLVLAIHKIQQEMGITGTTAKEAAETISGSKASLSAAWQDLLSAVGGEGDQARLDETLENFKTSFSTYMENFAPTLVKTISNSGSLVTAIADAIGDLPKDLLAQVASSGLESGTEMVGGVSKITGWLIDSLVSMFESAKANPQSLQNFGSAIGEFLGTTISDVVLNAPAIIEGIFNVGLNIAGGFIDGLINGISGRKSEVQQITDQMQQDIANADVDYSKAESLLRYLEKLQKKYGKTAAQTAEWKKTMEELDKILPGAGEAAMKYGSDLEGAIGKLREMNEQTRKQLVLSALQEAGNKQLAAIGAKQGELTESQIRQEQAQSAVETITPDLVENLQAYAKEMLRMNAEQDFMGPEMLEYYRALSSGTDAQGNALGTYDVDQLVSILTQVGRAIEERYDEDQPYIWDRDMNDSIQDVETLAKKAEAVKTAQTVIQQEIEKQAQLQTEIAELEEGYQTTWEALTRTVDGITADAEAGGKALEKGGETTRSAIQTAGGSAAAGIGSAGRTLAQTLTEINDKLPVPYTGPALPKAIGMNYVPYDGFRASLHRGEEVLTATQARARRNGGDTSDMVEALQALRQDLQNLRLVVGKKTFGRAVVDYGGSRVDGYIGEAESRYYAGYGT